MNSLVFVCPHDADHTRFITTYDLRKTCIVDGNGQIREFDPDGHENRSAVLRMPNGADDWICHQCGAKAQEVEITEASVA